jgi:hypothetical protein
MSQPYLSTNQVLDTSPDTYLSEWGEALGIIRSFSAELHLLDITSVDYAKALSERATEYCEEHRQVDSLTTDQIDQIKLLANTPLYLHNEKELSFFDSEKHRRRLPDDEWQYYQDFKPYMIWYNQLLADYAYTNRHDTLSSLNNVLIQQALTHFPNEGDAVERHIERATRGARTEAVARELLDRTPIDYSPGTIEDDLHGGDLIVTYQGHRIKVDIKSSIAEIAAVRDGYDEIDAHHLRYAILITRKDGGDKAKHVVVLFPGFTDSDLGDSLSLHLPEVNIQEHADSMAKQLKLAFAELHL